MHPVKFKRKRRQSVLFIWNFARHTSVCNVIHTFWQLDGYCIHHYRSFIIFIMMESLHFSRITFTQQCTTLKTILFKITNSMIPSAGTQSFLSRLVNGKTSTPPSSVNNTQSSHSPTSTMSPASHPSPSTEEGSTVTPKVDDDGHQSPRHPASSPKVEERNQGNRAFI